MVCFDRLDPGSICFRLCSTEGEHFDQVRSRTKHFDQVQTRKNVSTEFDRRVFSTEKNFYREKIVRLCSTEEKHFDRVRPRRISTEKIFFDCSTEEKNELDRGVFSTEKNFYREKIVRLCSTEEKHFDRVRPRRISTEKKNFDCVRPRKKSFERVGPRSFFDRKKISTVFDAGFSRLRRVSMYVLKNCLLL